MGGERLMLFSSLARHHLALLLALDGSHLSSNLGSFEDRLCCRFVTRICHWKLKTAPAVRVWYHNFSCFAPMDVPNT